MSGPLTEGAMAVLTRDIEDLGTDWRGVRKLRREGFRFVVEDYVSAEDAADGVAFYWGSAEGGINNVTVPADAVAQVMSADEVQDRTVPPLRSIGKYLCHLNEGDGFEIDEGDYSAVKDQPQSPEQCQVELYGRTDEGLRFALTVQIVALHEVDF